MENRAARLADGTASLAGLREIVATLSLLFTPRSEVSTRSKDRCRLSRPGNKWSDREKARPLSGTSDRASIPIPSPRSLLL